MSIMVPAMGREQFALGHAMSSSKRRAPRRVRQVGPGVGGAGSGGGGRQGERGEWERNLAMEKALEYHLSAVSSALGMGSGVWRRLLNRF